jgi:hypothetical protein
MRQTLAGVTSRLFRRALNPKKGKQLKAAASHSKSKSKARTTSRHSSSKPKPRSKSKSVAKVTTNRQSKGEVTRARATTPARATHGMGPTVIPARRTPIPSPLPTRHVAPTRTAVTLPARSMPPLARDQRRPSPPPAAAATPKPPVTLPEFAEAGVLLAITYSIREGRRGEFFDLMRELKPLLHAIGGGDVAVYEDRSRPNYLMEVFRFKDEVEFTAFDDKFHKDRKIAAIYALLDDIVEAEKSDFKIFERRL